MLKVLTFCLLSVASVSHAYDVDCSEKAKDAAASIIAINGGKALKSSGKAELRFDRPNISSWGNDYYVTYDSAVPNSSSFGLWVITKKVPGNDCYVLSLEF